MMRKAVNVLTRDSPRTFSLYLDHRTCLLAHLSDELPAASPVKHKWMQQDGDGVVRNRQGSGCVWPMMQAF